MYNFYTDMILRDMRIDAAVDALRDGYQQGKYSYKAGVAYIILDEKMFGPTKDKRKIRWAKRYLKKHNVSFDSLRLIATKAADSVSDMWQMTEQALLEKVPFLSRFL